MVNFQRQLEKNQEQVIACCEAYLPQHTKMGDQITLQEEIVEGMSYALLSGGKRLRPVFMLEAFRLFNNEKNYEMLMPFLASIEYIHNYSLVHDDLPCMDNDTMRHGMDSTWYKYGEGKGVLIGDAILNYAFETALKSFDAANEENQCFVINAMKVLAHKAGIFGMMGGQAVDVSLTNRAITEEELDFIYRLKTGALLEASFMIGGIIAGASKEQVAQLELIAKKVGFAFQIQDDILDITATESELGKPINSDERNHKTTYVSLFGIEKAKEQIEQLSKEAVSLLDTLPGDKEFMVTLIHSLIGRTK